MAVGKGYGVARGTITTATTTVAVAAPDTTQGQQGRIYVLQVRLMTGAAWTTGRAVVQDSVNSQVLARAALNTVDAEYIGYYDNVSEDFPGSPLAIGSALNIVTTGTPGSTDYEVIYMVR